MTEDVQELYRDVQQLALRRATVFSVHAGLCARRARRARYCIKTRENYLERIR